MMSEGFGDLRSLTSLNLSGRDGSPMSLRSLPESESPLTSHLFFSNFGNLMSKGFGNLAGLQKLNMENCRSLGSLPNSESRHSESFYFLIFDVQRLWAVAQLEEAQAE